MSGTEYRVYDRMDPEGHGDPMEDLEEARATLLLARAYAEDLGFRPEDFILQRLVPGEGWEAVEDDGE